MRLKWTNRMALVLMLTGALFMWACGDNGDDDGGTGPGDDPTFETDMLPIFQDNGCTGCHGANNPQADFTITDYDDLISEDSNNFGNPYVVSGEPDNSELIWRMEGTNGIPRMPPGGGQVPQNEIDLVREWISAGAPEEGS